MSDSIIDDYCEAGMSVALDAIYTALSQPPRPDDEHTSEPQPKAE